jgi:hypothetical protein
MVFSLAQALVHYDKLEQISRRLKILASASNIVPFDSTLAERVSCINNTLRKLASALDEIANMLDMFNGLQTEPLGKISVSFVNQSKALAASTNVLCDRLGALLYNVKLATLSFLLESKFS